MEYDAVQVLGIGENAPPVQRASGVVLSFAHNILIATVTAATVMAKLTQGPQSIAPTITTIAKNGQNDLPNTSPLCSKNECKKDVCAGPVMVRSVRLRFSLWCSR